jgi:hypothetical protein
MGRRGSVLAAAVIAALALFPAAALAAGTTSVVMYSEPGDYIGLHTPREYHPGNAQVTLGGTANRPSVWVYKGDFDSFYFDFAAPDDLPLVPGIYDNAQETPFRQPGHPGISISGSGRGCGTEGRFEVKDIAVGQDGVPTRLWIVFEQRCDSHQGRLFGEVRIGVPPDSPVLVTPSIVRWPTSYYGLPGLAVPVNVFASVPVTFTSASVIGADATSFPISADQCSGQAIAAGGSCSVSIGFDASTLGDHEATLRLVDSVGTTYEVALQGSATDPEPTNLTVSQHSRYVTAGWTLPQRPLGVLTGFLEFASDPTTDDYGFFTDPNTVAYLYDTHDTTFDSTPDQFPPGTYYVHVSASDPRTCDPSANYCYDVFSTPPVKLVIPPDPAPPSSPAPTPITPPPPVSADTVTAFASLKVPSRQRVGKLYVEAGLAEAGTIVAGGTVNVPNLSKLYRFKTASARVAAGATARLQLKLPAKALKAVKKALKHGKRLKAKITITASDEAGNRKTERRTIRLTR